MVLRTLFDTGSGNRSSRSHNGTTAGVDHVEGSTLAELRQLEYGWKDLKWKGQKFRPEDVLVCSRGAFCDRVEE